MAVRSMKHAEKGKREKAIKRLHNFLPGIQYTDMQ